MQEQDKIQREVLPIADRQHVGVTTYDAKDPDTKYPPIGQYPDYGGTGGRKRLFFASGPSCLRNIIANQVPVPEVNDIYITRLHVDHFGEPRRREEKL